MANEKRQPLTPGELEYRNLLITTQHQLNTSYDKLVVVLAGGALALSMTFLKDVVNLKDAEHIGLLILSWALFILSLAAIFGEILFGMAAYEKAVKQLDDNKIRTEKVGGLFSSLTKWFSRLAAISLVMGLFVISVFVFTNIGDENATKTTLTNPTTPTTLTTPTTPTTLTTSPNKGGSERSR